MSFLGVSDIGVALIIPGVLELVEEHLEIYWFDHKQIFFRFKPPPLTPPPLLFLPPCRCAGLPRAAPLPPLFAFPPIPSIYDDDDAWMGCMDGKYGWDAWMGCMDGMHGWDA